MISFVKRLTGLHLCLQLMNFQVSNVYKVVKNTVGLRSEAYISFHVVATVATATATNDTASAAAAITATAAVVVSRERFTFQGYPDNINRTNTSDAWVLAGWLLGSWVRIPLKARRFVRVFLYCVVLCR
jgi:hypothetical protein